MKKVIITAGVRTPIGVLGGSLSSVTAAELGAVAATETIKRAGIAPEKIRDVIVGNVLQAGQGQNPARQIALMAGLGLETSACTVNQVCGSGLKALELGWQNIKLGRSKVVLAGGVESMSRAPHLLPALRQGMKLGNTELIDSVLHDGLRDVFNNYHMGITAENLAARFRISREEQDAFALLSQTKTGKAVSAGIFSGEMVAVPVRSRKDTIHVQMDEHPRPDTTAEKLAQLRPAFANPGTVTAGNASGVNDGAASVMLVDAECGLAAGLNPDQSAYLVDFAVCGCDPAMMGIGPVEAVRLLLERTGIRSAEIDLWELNEAFAAQSLAVMRELDLPADTVNVNGGAIALGHPIGASGARIMVTLLHELKRRKARFGIATLCIGGGMGIAALIENL